jgi:uncharacterized membrane protein
MFTFYNLFLFIHTVSVCVWLGGLTALVFLGTRLARKRDTAGIAAVARAGEFFGRTVVGPAAGITLLAGIGMVVDSHRSFATLWILWGVSGLVVSILLGATLIRRTRVRLDEAALREADTAGEAGSLQGRMLVLQAVNLLVLFSVVWAMVFKPAL